MVRRWLFSLCLVMLLSGLAAAQTKTVTNADLEKFRQKRVAGEKGLKAYYARQGMTEEDVAKKEAADAKAREELSARLRSERLEREWLAYERMRLAPATPPQVNVYVPQTGRCSNGGFGCESQYNSYYPYYPYYPNYYPYGVQRNRRYENTGPRWRATPMGIIIESPAPVLQYPQRSNRWPR